MMGRLVGNPVFRLFAFTTVVLMITMGLAGFYAFGVSQRYLLPELDLKAQTVGAAVVDKVGLAQKYGIPFDHLVGMDDYLASILKSQPDIAYIAITDNGGAPVYRAGLDDTRLRSLFGEAGATPAAADDGWALWLSRTSLEFTGPLPRRADATGGYLDTTLPLASEGRPLGALHVGVSIGFYQGQIGEQVFDIAIALVVALLISFEILLATATINLSGPLETLISTLRQGANGVLARPRRAAAEELDRIVTRTIGVVDGVLAALGTLGQRIAALRESRPERDAQNRLNAIEQTVRATVKPADDGTDPVDTASAFIGARVCAFLFVLAEEIARPFMPVFIQGIARQDGFGNGDMVVGLPMSLFLLMVALAMPVAAAWSQRVGHRRTFVLGAVCSTIGLIGTAMGPSYALLLVWRALSGLGYSMTFVACQGHVLDHAGPYQRARGVAVFVGGITAADICGPAIGGMLATRVGFDAVLLIGGGLAAAAAGFGLWALRGHGAAGPVAATPSQGGMFQLLRNGRFTVLLLLTAMPAKMLLSGALFFLVPLVASEQGASQGEIGRLVMLYGIAGFLLSTPFAREADRWNLHGLAVGLGGMIAGAGIIPMLFNGGMTEVTIAVIGLGIGQSMSISPQLALAMRVCEAETERYGQAPVVGLYRLAERLGGAVGPFLASGLVGLFGHAGAMAALGCGTAAAAALFSVIFLVTGVAPHPDDQIEDFDPTDSRPGSVTTEGAR